MCPYQTSEANGGLCQHDSEGVLLLTEADVCMVAV